ncbi:MAG: hypothetical protein KKA73_19265 [Chloroflexi bacterium]|nr:hypothetical protein [Chloroflexota bacterium]MBU1749829.1 hypothetical protein [Chloroflexota bacterium]MBU1877324.1 hypothetical protein [Chloroflexota bacterium]
MSTIPIVHMTLYKHGVGFFRRQADLAGEEVQLSFRVEEMNDILKSLTVIDRGGGQVFGVDYATPQSREERLAGCTVSLADDRSLQDLLVSLRGRRVRLLLDQAESAEGTLLGLDEVAERQPLDSALVSLLEQDGQTVSAVPLGRLHGVAIQDEQGAGDLRFFLSTALSQEDYRQVTIRLSPGQHLLDVSYIAPAPTWRVSYRLVAEETPEGLRALLQGWGIFDNRLEEDLKQITLNLVAGMPISFVYDLYTPFTPERPVVEEEKRVAAAPVEFAMAQEAEAPAAPRGEGMTLGAGMMDVMRAAPAPKLSRAAMTETVQPTATGKALGELFQYTIATPVTVGRGQSAMVPIVGADLGYRKELIYNGAKLPAHPVATLRMDNATGLTLERGPVTVLEEGEYVGEAVLPFTVDGAEMVVPYSVELGVKVREESDSRRETYGLHIDKAYLVIESWEIQQRTYWLNNSLGKDITVLVEHLRRDKYEPFETSDPKETTADHLRYEVAVPARQETKFQVQERRRLFQREEIRNQTAERLRWYLNKGWLQDRAFGQLNGLINLWQQIGINEQLIAEAKKERDGIYKAQTQIQGNMQALGTAGKEGALRAQYVDKLAATEKDLESIAQRVEQLQQENRRLQKQVDEALAQLT